MSADARHTDCIPLYRENQIRASHRKEIDDLTRWAWRIIWSAVVSGLIVGYSVARLWP